MAHKLHDTGISKNLGRYSDAVEVSPGQRWLYTAGTPGMSKDGNLPEDISGQSRMAWQNVLDALQEANMTTADLVKVTTSLTSSADIPAYVEVRSEILGDLRPVFMLQVVSELIRPAVLIEIEIVAAAP